MLHCPRPFAGTALVLLLGIAPLLAACPKQGGSKVAIPAGPATTPEIARDRLFGLMADPKRDIGAFRSLFTTDAWSREHGFGSEADAMADRAFRLVLDAEVGSDMLVNEGLGRAGFGAYMAGPKKGQDSPTYAWYLVRGDDGIWRVDEADLSGPHLKAYIDGELPASLTALPGEDELDEIGMALFIASKNLGNNDPDKLPMVGPRVHSELQALYDLGAATMQRSYYAAGINRGAVCYKIPDNKGYCIYFNDDGRNWQIYDGAPDGLFARLLVGQ